MRDLCLALALALAVAGIGAVPASADAGQPAGCAVSTPRGSVALPSSACDHAPTLSGADCVLSPAAGLTIALPREACEHGPRPVDGASAPPTPAPAGACQVITDEGQAIPLPEAACQHLPSTVAPGVPGPRSACVLLTPSGRMVRLPARACQLLPSLTEAGVLPAMSLYAAPASTAPSLDLSRDDSCDAFVRYVRLVDRQVTRGGG